MSNSKFDDGPKLSSVFRRGTINTTFLCFGLRFPELIVMGISPFFSRKTSKGGDLLPS